MKRPSLIVLACLPLAAAEYLPLQDGNTWTYRQASGIGSGSFTITVGAPATIVGNGHFPLDGYVGRRVLVRNEA